METPSVAIRGLWGPSKGHGGHRSFVIHERKYRRDIDREMGEGKKKREGCSTKRPPAGR